MAKSPTRKNTNSTTVAVSRALPAGKQGNEEKLESSIAWQGSGRGDRLDNESSGMDHAVGLAERDLSSPVTSETWTPDLQLHERASTEYVGQWNRLVSQTNWEKGRLIVQWRLALEQERVPALEYSDEAWSRLVGGVTSQHVGRLRRVYLKFGRTQESFSGLYWSHFHAALEWDDAELWLQGALEKRWSVSQMRHQRWETMGQLAEQKPDPQDIVHGELDEDLDLREAKGRDDFADYQAGPRLDGPDFGDDSLAENPRSTEVDDLSPPSDPDRVTITNENSVPGFRPFESVGQLPEPFSELVEDFKLAIIRFKTDGWEEVSQPQVLTVLDGLKHLVESQSDLVDQQRGA